MVRDRRNLEWNVNVLGGRLFQASGQYEEETRPETMHEEIFRQDLQQPYTQIILSVTNIIADQTEALLEQAAQTGGVTGLIGSGIHRGYRGLRTGLSVAPHPKNWLRQPIDSAVQGVAAFGTGLRAALYKQD